MKMPTSSWGRFWFYFGVQFISYGLQVANGRAYVQANYMWTALTDAGIAVQTFFIIRSIAKESGADAHLPSFMGYVSGGVAGALFAIWITVRIYGQ